MPTCLLAGQADRPSTMPDKDRKRKPEAADDGASAPVEQKKKKKYGDKKERKNPVPQSHKEQKELRKKRKEEENPNHALVVRLKELWEGLRVKSGTAEVREKTVDEILELIHGKAKEVIFQHDSARIVQSAIKYGTMAQRAKLFQEVKGEKSNRWLPFARKRGCNCLISLEHSRMRWCTGAHLSHRSVVAVVAARP